MKILIVSQHFYPETFRINDIAFSFSKLGHEVTVLTGLPNYPSGTMPNEYKWFKKRNEVISNVHVIRTSIFSRKSSLFNMALNYVSFGINASIKSLFFNKTFDVIFSFQTSPISMVLPAIAVKYKQKIPLFIHCLDQWPISVTTGPINDKSILYKFLFHLSKWIYNQADIITLSSKSFKEYFTNTLKIKETKGLIYWPSYAEDIYQVKNILKKDTFDLVFAGNIGPAQNVEMIVHAAHLLTKYSDIQLHIVGDGLSLEICKQIASDYGLNNITFYGHHSVNEMPKFFEMADAFLITMVDNEVVNKTLPAKVQSYLLAGKPIIGAINGEVRDVIEEANCGLVCDSDDLDKFIENILISKNNPDLRKVWSYNAYKYYETHFDKTKLINQILELFKNQIER